MPIPRALALCLALLLPACGGGGGGSSKPPGNDDGDAAFRLDFPAAYPTPAEPTGCTLADLDADGRLDAVVATRGGELAVYLGSGAGFVPLPAVALGGELGRPVAADLDADGHVDVALPLFDTNELVVLLGRGDGTFDPPLKTAVASLPRQLDADDLDGDGVLDLLVRRDAPDALEAWLGVGDGTFVLGPSTPLEVETIELARGDWNGDGRLDVAVSVLTGTVRVRVLVAQGDGSFVDAGSIQGPSSPGRLAGVDLNGNGKDDLVVADAVAGSILTYLGDGAAGFTLAGEVDVQSFAHDLAITDLDGDGAPDVVVAVGFYGQVFALRGSGTGALEVVLVHDVPELPLALAAGDWSGDGAPDLLAVDFTGTRLLALRNDAGRLRAPEILLDELGVTDLVEFDWSGDGPLDLALAEEDWKTLELLRATASGSYEAADTIGFSGSLLALDAGDANGDGQHDLVVAPKNDPPRLELLLADGLGGFEAPVALLLGVSTPTDVEFADFDVDGSLDVVAATGFEGLLVRLGNGDGTFGAPLVTDLGFAPGGPLAVADFNGDGIPDVAAAKLFSPDPGLGELHVLYGDGAGTFPAELLLSIPQEATAVLAPDLDGDGQADLAVSCRGAATTSRGVLLWRATGTGLFVDAGTALTDTALEGLAVHDLDGNGTLDLVAGTRTGITGELLVVRRTKSGALEERETWGLGFPPRAFSCRDLDGDGHVDLVAAGGSFPMGRVALIRQRGSE